MKNTPLNSIHEKIGGRMVEFAGWRMSLQYSSILAEHKAVRSSAGIFDLSHMGEFFVEGEDAEKFLQYMMTNDIAKLTCGKILYTLMCNEHGGVVDDILVYRFSDKRFMLVVNASNTQKDYEWLKKHIGDYKLRLSDKTDSFALIAVQGPAAESILQKSAAEDLNSINYYWFAETSVCGVNVILSRTGYTGDDGFEIYLPAEKAEKMWRDITVSAGNNKLLPIGLGARDSLRIEASFSLYGHEITEDITPVEAGLSWAVKDEKGNFIGKDSIIKRKKEMSPKNLVCFSMKESGIPRQGYSLFYGAERIGEVTSGTFSPVLSKGIGMGFSHKKIAVNDEIQVEIRGKKYPCTVIKRPFYKRLSSSH